MAIASLGIAASLACGNRTSDTSLDTAITSVSSHAVGAWANAGPRGLLDFLSVGVQAHCTVGTLTSAFADQPAPSAWSETKDIESVSPTETRATVVFDSGGQQIEQTWSFALENYSWRISDMPGLADCTS
jgi:hypothetical protein